MLPAAEQRLRVKIVATALRRLSAKRPLSRKAAFENVTGVAQSHTARLWHVKVLKRLEGKGLITIVKGIRDRFDDLYLAADPDELIKIADDKILCADLLWPRPVIGEDAAETDMVDAVAEDPPPALLPATPAPDSGEVDPALVLKLLAATVENVVYMRERLDELARRVDALAKLWEPSNENAK